MKLANRYVLFVLAVVILAIGAGIFSAGVVAQEEGCFVEVRLFDVRMQEARRDDWDDRPARYGDRDRDDWNGLKIIRAYYGIQGRTVNVTDMLRARVRDGAMSFVVTNNALGGDP